MCPIAASVHLGAPSSALVPRTGGKPTLSISTKLLLSERRARRLARGLLVVAAAAYGGAGSAVCSPCVQGAAFEP